MISTLSLRNWRTHRDTAVQLGRGTNLVIGIMGSGKSGLLDALSYALFGTFPQLKRREASLADAITHGENEARVSLGFSHEGKEYSVARALKKSGEKVTAGAKFSCGGKVLDSGTRRVNELISSTLGVDYDLFTRAIYSEQNNIDYFLTIDPAKRKREMDRLLGLDRFETARAASVSLLNRISHDADSLSRHFSQEEYASLKSQEAEKSALLKSLEEKARSLQNQHKELKENSSGLSKKLSSLESLLKKRDSLKSAIERASARAEALSPELEGKSPSQDSLAKMKESLEALSAKKKSLDSQLAETENAISAASLSLGKTASKLTDAKSSSKKIAELESELSSLSKIEGKTPESLLEEADSALLASTSKIESLSSRIAELKEAIGQLKPGISKCPVCDSGLSPHAAERILGQKKEKLNSLDSELSTLNKSLLPLKERKRQLLRKIEKKNTLSSSISQLKERASALPRLEKEKSAKESELKLLAGKKSSLNSSREKCAKEYSDALLAYREEESLLKKAQFLKSAREEMERSKEEFSQLKFEESELAKVRKESEEARISLERASSSLDSLKKEKQYASESLSMLRPRIMKMGEARKESEYLQKLRAELQIYRNSLIELQSELRAELTGAIGSAMNNIWPILYPYADYKQLRIVATEKDYFFEVNDGEWRRLEKIASGGEKACLSLTLRMALSTVLTPNVGWMMLDEPTHNLDAEAIHTLSEALENKVPEIIPQSIVITHEENLISSEFARSYKFSRDKGSLGPTVVESL